MHDSFHKHAERIRRLPDSSAPQAVHEAVGPDSDFERLSNALIQALFAWHDEIVGK